MKNVLMLMLIAVICLTGCSQDSKTVQADASYQCEETEPDVSVQKRAVKIEQLIGDFDIERQEPTGNQTFSRYRLLATDLGVPFRHKDKTYLVFGDCWGAQPRDRDAIAYTVDTNPEDGIALTFLTDAQGNFRPVYVPGLMQEGFEVPLEGVSVNDRMYIYHTTDYTVEENGKIPFVKTVVAVSDDDGMTFKYLYDFSRLYFVCVSATKCRLSDWPVISGPDREVLIMFGSGEYRKSHVYLAYQFSEDIENPDKIRYFTGLDDSARPRWSQNEEESVPLFNHPCVGELSVTFNPFIRKWIMTYNCTDPRGIMVRTADYPWGPWTKAQVLFDPVEDGGFGHFMHIPWTEAKQDSVHDPGRENQPGGEYGPYQFGDLATGSGNSTTIYFTLSTWNPYTVVLMKATLQKNP